MHLITWLVCHIGGTISARARIQLLASVLASSCNKCNIKRFFALHSLQAAQCEDKEEGTKIYYKGKLYSVSSDQPDIVLAREAWTEIINDKYKSQGNESGSESDSMKNRLEEKGLSRDVLDIVDWWKMKISAGSLAHYGVREGRRRMESKYEWGLEDFR